MEQTKYDVFISYSRKDYVKDDVVIPGNPITAIQEMFDKNDISYWFDKDGIYSGQEFVEVISNAIANSKMLVFVSSKHSNASMWTAGEIFEAVDGEKLIIPVRIDDCPYNKKFKLLIRPLDYVDYQGQPNTALPQLLRAVNIEKEKIAKKEEEVRQRLLKEQEETKREAVKIEIKEKAKEYQALAGQQDYILKELYSKNKFIGNTIKRCPVCEKDVPIQSQFCSQCGWQFPKLYGIDGGNVPLHDDTQLAIARKCWQGFDSIKSMQKENDSLKIDNEKLEKSLSDIKMECEEHLKDIDKKDSQLAAYQRELKSVKEKNAELEQERERQISSIHRESQKIKEENVNIMKEYDAIKKKLSEVQIDKEKAIAQVETLKDELKVSQTNFKKASDDYMYKLLENVKPSDAIMTPQSDSNNEDNSMDMKIKYSKDEDLSSAFLEVQHSKEGILHFVKSFCNNKHINNGTNISKAKIRFNKLAKGISETYKIDLSEHKLKEYSTIGDLIDEIWKLSH